MTIAAYNGARALLERDFAEEPDKLKSALAKLDDLRAVRAAPNACRFCGSGLKPGQVAFCSPGCANADWYRVEQERQEAFARGRERLAAEDAGRSVR